MHTDNLVDCNAMWVQYRKTIVPTQAFILALTAVLYWKADFALLIVVVFFVTMQLMVVVGAAWAARIIRKIETQRDALPLERL